MYLFWIFLTIQIKFEYLNIIIKKLNTPKHKYAYILYMYMYM